ncbi:MAG: sulfite exporter TauE/SafE family protein [Ruminococcaceae bacterium]|nr:sulfite exporter TauE/SafE family protein [Oscillospiraceae bacterium]
MEFWEMVLFICPMLFLAGMIDGISGGGGIISLPTYLIAGIPMNAAYGCNKLQSFLGTSASLAKYAKCGLLDWKPAMIACGGAVIGANAATHVMMHLTDSVKSWIIIGAMCFIITLTLLTFRMQFSETDIKKLICNKKNAAQCFGLGLLLGMYDGFFGPGCGTVAMMLFSVLFKYDLHTAVGNGKIIIVVSNLISLISYIRTGNVLYSVALPASAANMIGSYIGASLAVKKGKKLVRGVLLLVTAVLLVQAFIKLI